MKGLDATYFAMKQYRCCGLTVIVVQVYIMCCFWMNLSCPIVNDMVCTTGTRPITHVNTAAEECPITWVTSYFKLTGKHSHAEYMMWIGNMRQIKKCLVVYTDVFNVSFGDPSTTLIVPTSLCAVSSYHLDMTGSERNSGSLVDPGCHLHNHYELYWKQAMNAFFLNATAVSNPFQSQSFFWIDSGYFRDNRYGGRDISGVKAHSIKPGVMTFMLLNPLWMWRINMHIPSPIFLDAIAGNLFGGDGSAVQSWCTRYKQLLILYRSSGLFWVNDKTMMNRICFEIPGLCHYIRHNRALHESVWGALFPMIITDNYI